MHDLKRFISGALVLAGCLLPGYATAQTKTLNLTLKGGVELILENNLDITIERVSPRIAEAKVEKELGAFDTDVFGSFKRTDSTAPLSARSRVAAGGLSKVESESYNLETGVTGKNSFGTTYTFEVKDGWTADTLSGFEYEYESFTGVTITQPIFKGFGKDANEQLVSIARKDRDISIHRLRESIISVVADYSFAYWELVRAREELMVMRESQSLAHMLLEINKKKLEAGSISALDVKQAEAAASARKDDVYVAEKNVRERENALKLLISKDVYALKDTKIIPDVTAVSFSTAGFDESVESAVRNRPDYQEAKSTIEKSNIRIRYAVDQKYPKVDLEASYGYNGLGSSFSDSFSGIDSNPQWSLGLVMRYPLGNKTSSGDLAVARLEADQALLRLKKIEQAIVMGVDASIKDIESDRVRVEASRVSTLLTEEALIAEEKKLAAGRSTTYNVLKVQEDLAKARLNEIGAVSDYNRSLIRYHREKGTLLDELGVKLKEVR